MRDRLLVQRTGSSAGRELDDVWCRDGVVCWMLELLQHVHWRLAAGTRLCARLAARRERTHLHHRVAKGAREDVRHRRRSCGPREDVREKTIRCRTKMTTDNDVYDYNYECDYYHDYNDNYNDDDDDTTIYNCY